jgi:hypothetical protein
LDATALSHTRTHPETDINTSTYNTTADSLIDLNTNTSTNTSTNTAPAASSHWYGYGQRYVLAEEAEESAPPLEDILGAVDAEASPAEAYEHGCGYDYSGLDAGTGLGSHLVDDHYGLLLQQQQQQQQRLRGLGSPDAEVEALLSAEVADRRIAEYEAHRRRREEEEKRGAEAASASTSPAAADASTSASASVSASPTYDDAATSNDDAADDEELGVVLYAHHPPPAQAAGAGAGAGAESCSPLCGSDYEFDACDFTDDEE